MFGYNASSVVPGSFTAGNSVKGDFPDVHALYGNTVLVDVPGSIVDGDDVLNVRQVSTLTNTAVSSAVVIDRVGILNTFDYFRPVVRIRDQTASMQPILEVQKQGAVILRTDGDGVVINGKYKTGSAVAHTLGAYSGFAEPVYNEGGVLLGYRPLYV